MITQNKKVIALFLPWSEAVVLRCSIEKVLLIFLAQFSGKHLPRTRLWYRCFRVNFAKFLRAAFLQNISGQLLLQVLLKSYGCHYPADNYMLKVNNRNIRTRCEIVNNKDTRTKPFEQVNADWV